MWRIFMAKSNLQNTRKSFRSQLRSGPLAGRVNETLVKSRFETIRLININTEGLKGNDHLLPETANGTADLPR